MKNKTATFFDGYAQEFTALYGNQNKLLNRIANHLFRKSMYLRYVNTIEGCTPIQGRSVIDIGCGPGLFSVALARKGAQSVVGIDFAEGMLNIARANAEKAGVSEKCTFEHGDILTYENKNVFDYAIVMGLMDYMNQPEKIVKKVLSMTREKAFFSFPVDGGFLAWQRKFRYRWKCPLFMYTEEQVRKLFTEIPKVRIIQIDRDYFVEASLK